MNFISISVDQDDADWQKALEEEKLPWEQFLATPETVRDTRTSYKLEGIPTFFIVSPDGRIIFSGHNSGELEWQLHKLFKEK
ncbi:MAG: thioredoxin-like domain-containing protein [Marinifilaceae bacterium]|nr:thioredoxin-like domain-containing protein [Marinifilaceae bacterium]